MRSRVSSRANLAAGVCAALCAGAVVADSAVGLVSARNSVVVSSADFRVDVDPGSPLALSAGDRIATVGSDSWANLRIDGFGVVELGPDSTVVVDRIGSALRLAVEEGGLCYRLDGSGEAIVEAGPVVLRPGHADGDGLTAVSTSTAYGAVALGPDTSVYAANRSGELVGLGRKGNAVSVPSGQIYTFDDSTAVPVTPDVVGQPAVELASETVAWWSGCGAGPGSPAGGSALASSGAPGAVFASSALPGVGGAAVIYQAVTDDKDPFSSRR